MPDPLELALEAASSAGSAIMKHYDSHLSARQKDDGSPVTDADLAADQAIHEVLASSGIAIVSEEGKEAAPVPQLYWLVDPLDGTKDFLAGTGEFTVNIALVENGSPRLGVVLAPLKGDIYWGQRDVGGWRIREGIQEKLGERERSPDLKMAVSRSDVRGELDIFMEMNRIAESVAVGSALKYGLLAAAECDVVPRLVGSSEWDTAAGQAVLEAAGGHVVEWDTGKPLVYGKPRRRNSRLLAVRSPYHFENFSLKSYLTPPS